MRLSSNFVLFAALVLATMQGCSKDLPTNPQMIESDSWVLPMNFHYAIVQLRGIDMRLRVHHTFPDSTVPTDDWYGSRDTIYRIDTLLATRPDTISNTHLVLNCDRSSPNFETNQTSLSLFFNPTSRMIDSALYSRAVSQTGVSRGYIEGASYRLIGLPYVTTFAGLSIFKRLASGDSTIQFFDYYHGRRSFSNFTSINDATDLTEWQCKRIEGYQPDAYISIWLIP